MDFWVGVMALQNPKKNKTKIAISAKNVCKAFQLHNLG